MSPTLGGWAAALAGGQGLEKSPPQFGRFSIARNLEFFLKNYFPGPSGTRVSDQGGWALKARYPFLRAFTWAHPWVNVQGLSPVADAGKSKNGFF